MEKMKAINPAIEVIVVTGSDPYGMVPGRVTLAHL